MKPKNILKTPLFSQAQITAAILAAPDGADSVDSVDSGDVSAEPNIDIPVTGFWEKAEIRMPGKRGAQKMPLKVAVTVRYSPEVIAYFKSTGEGWQTRMNDALCEYVSTHKAA